MMEYEVMKESYADGSRRVTITRYSRRAGVLSEIRERADMPELRLSDLPLGRPVTFKL